MAITIIPVVMSRGFIRQTNVAADTAAPKRIWDPVAPSPTPQADTRGFLMQAKAGNGVAIRIGSAIVAIAGVEEGYALAAGDVITGALVDAGAHEIYAIAPVGVGNYYLGEVG